MNPTYAGHRSRLRARLRESGPAAFPDYEMLELLLACAIPRRDTKPLAKRLIERFGSLKGVLDAGPAQITAVEGAGRACADLISLFRGVMARYWETEVRQTDLVNSPEAAVAYCRAALEGLGHEVFDVIYLSTKNRVLGRRRLTEGTIDQSAVYPRRVVAEALAANAAGLIFVHNYPSGDPTPSADDRRVTTQLAAAAKTVGIPVLDHIIVGNGRHYSFRAQGLL